MFVRIDDLIKQTNIYIQSGNTKQLLLKSIYEYLNKIFKSLGLDYEVESDSTGTNERAINIMDTFVKFRDNIRSNAKTDFKTIL